MCACLRWFFVLCLFFCFNCFGILGITLVCLGCTSGLLISVLHIYIYIYLVCLLKTRRKTSNRILKDEAMDFENRRSLGMIANQRIYFSFVTKCTCAMIFLILIR